MMEGKERMMNDQINSTKWVIRKKMEPRKMRILSLVTLKPINKVTRRTNHLKKTHLSILHSEVQIKVKLEVKENKTLPPQTSTILPSKHRNNPVLKLKLIPRLKNAMHLEKVPKRRKLTLKWRRRMRMLPLLLLLPHLPTVLRSKRQEPNLHRILQLLLNHKIDLPRNLNALSEMPFRIGDDVSKLSATWLNLKKNLNLNRRLSIRMIKKEQSNTFKMETSKKLTNKLSVPPTRNKFRNSNNFTSVKSKKLKDSKPTRT